MKIVRDINMLWDIKSLLKTLKSMRKNDTIQKTVFTKRRKEMKKTLLAAMAATMVLSSSLTAFAAPETMPDGTIFDAEYYAQSNPDVVAVFGTDRDSLYTHYMTYGKEEGRLPYALTNEEIQNPSEGMTNLNSSTVKIEAGDENYLRAGYLSVGYNYSLEPNIWGITDPAYGFIRADYSSDAYYQQLKEFILGEIAINGGKDANEFYVDTPFIFTPTSIDEMLAIANIYNNLVVDLQKDEICNHICARSSRMDGKSLGWWGKEFYDFKVSFSVNYDNAEDVEYYHPEVKGYY